MRELTILFIHLIVTSAKLMRPGGGRGVVAESLLLKHQLLILNRGRERASNLRQIDRVIAGLCSLVIHPGRLLRLAIVLRPPTLLAFWAARELENKLLSFRDFYNDQRCHYALDGDTPSESAGKKRGNDASLDSYAWQSHCRGLFQLPVAA